MIIEQQKQATIVQHGIVEDDTIKMSLDIESSSFLMQMLSKNLYSDAIGSICREICSNALDSHRNAKTNKPIIVNFGSVDGKYEFSVEDFGLGLDDEDVKNIISKYGKSTKRADNQAIGMFGLGFKVGLAYNSSFFFICRKNGIERKYMMYENQSENSIDLLYESKTTEPNGVKVIIPVEYYDRYSFVSKIKEQLCYFETVHFNVADVPNDFTILREKDFQISSLSQDSKLHISLDNVYYSIDWKALGVSSISIPVALRFSLTDGIYPLPNREQLKYTKETIEIIKAKIKTVANYFVTLYNKNVKNSNSPLDLYKSMRDDKLTITLNDKFYVINDLAVYSDVEVLKPSLTGFSLLPVDTLLGRSFNNDLILQEYEIVNKIDNGKWKTCSRHYDREINFCNLSRKVILVSDNIKGIKKEYLKEKYDGTGHYNSTLIVKKTDNLPLIVKGSLSRKNYFNLLDLHTHPKDKWRTIIKEFQQFVKLITNNWIDGDKIVVPQEFIDARKKPKASVTYTSTRSVKLSGEVTVKKAEKLERYVSGKSCKWVNYNWDLAKICKHKSLIVYGQEKDLRMMDKLFDVLDKYQLKTKITLLQITDREMKIVKDLNIHNLISFDKFMEGKNKPFKRLVTAYLINKLNKQNPHVFEKSKYIKALNTDLGEKIEALEQYEDKHFNRANDEMWNAMLEVATTHNLWDETVYSTYLEVKGILDRLTFLEAITYHISYGRENEIKENKLFQAMVDLCKYHKFKINSEYYAPIITPVEELTEETILETI